MNSSTYALNPRHMLWQHGFDRSRQLHDRSNDLESISDRRAELHAQVKSGDLFATLATKLDELHAQIAEVDTIASQQLQAMVTDLLYLQSHYTVTQKLAKSSQT